MDMPVVETKKVSKIYHQGGGSIKAVDSIDLQVSQGEFLAIVGRSGAGKTTLLNLIGALDMPSSGMVLLDGVDMSKASTKEMALVRRKKIGFVFQNFNLLPALTVFENLEVALATTEIPMEEQKKRIKDLLSFFELYGKMDCLPNELSLGQQQRVAIARALVNNPSLILADEPTGEVDSITAKGVVDKLVELNQRFGITLIVATHGSFPYKVAKRVLFMKDGRIIPFEETEH
jgi:putative ABC transport system ATP-binding protein